MEPLKQNYAFDVIVIEANIPDPPIDADGIPSDRTFSIRLLDEYMDLPQNRIITNYFPGKPLGEFVTSPCDLIGALSSSGISVTVYDNDRILGTGKAMLSSGLLRMLTDQTFKSNEKVTVELIKDKKSIGTLELNIKFSSADPDLDTRLKQFGCYDICRPLDKSVNPRDVIFTLGRSGRCAATSCITDERLMSHAGAPFNCVHAKSDETAKDCSCLMKGVKPPPDLDQAKERERNLLKKLLLDIQVDRESVPTPPSGYARSRAAKCKCLKKKGSSSSGSSVYFSPTDSWSDDLDEDTIKVMDACRNFGGGDEQEEKSRNRCLGVCPQLNPPILMSNKYKPPKLCPLCNANITWLPKIAACPYCGYKRFDIDKPSEEPFDESTTASEVIRNHFLQQQADNVEGCVTGEDLGLFQLEPKPLSKQCTCNSGKVCTRCRIRELCEKMSRISDKKAAAQASPEAEVKALKKKPSTASQRREELVNIFTEMRDNYSCKKNKETEPTVSAENIKRAKANLRKTLKETDKGLACKLMKNKIIKSKRRARSTRYTFLAQRPRTAHLCCSRGSGRVPCNMGWMWTANELARYKCWKPGAIAKSIRQLMCYFLRDYPVDVMSTSRRHGRRRGELSTMNKKKSAEEESLIQHPTLHIKKKHDEYTITLRPLKDAKTLALAANPYANMKPVVFRIVKDPFESGKREIKIGLKELGFPVCTCNQPVVSCYCRSHIDKLSVEHAVKKLSEERGWKDISEDFVFSDLSESDSENELDFGVTPPAGVVKPERLRRPDRVHIDTQYDVNDWAMPTVFPHLPSHLQQYGNCVVGERRSRFPWIMGKGYVHRVPKPAKKKGKPLPIKKERQKGGFDDGLNYIYGTRRSWHRSNEFTYDNGVLW